MEEFRSNLRTIDKQLGRQLGKKNEEVADKVVELSEKRLALLSGKYPSYRSGYVRMKGSANQRKVQVRIQGAAEQGIARHPVFGRWQDQSEFARRVWPKPNRGGYVVRPTVEEQAPVIGEIYLDEISEFARNLIGV